MDKKKIMIWGTDIQVVHLKFDIMLIYIDIITITIFLEKNKQEVILSNLIIGRKIRKLRKIRGLSLTALSSELGMSYSYLSALENGKHSISITNLQKLASYFDVNLLYFLEDDSHKNAVFISKNERNVTQTSGGINFQIITPSAAEKIQVTFIEMPPHSPEEKNIHKHKPGDELITVISGKLFVMVEDTKYELKKEDSIFFHSDMEHTIYTQEKAAKFILISSPPNRSSNI